MEGQSTNNESMAKIPTSAANVKKKRPPRFSLFKAAMAMIGSRPNEKSKAKSVTNNNTDAKWKKVVGSMRPLHMMDNQSPPPQNAMVEIAKSERSEDEFFPLSPSSSSTSAHTMSQYASALNLHDIVKDGGNDFDDDDDSDKVFDNYEADVMIDAKAEEFIAQFYEQMRNQQKGKRVRKY